MSLETQAWANQTRNNTVIFHDNDFEVFIDCDGSNHFYKELELNARTNSITSSLYLLFHVTSNRLVNRNWNLLLVKPYLNGGPAVCNYTSPNMCTSHIIVLLCFIVGKSSDPRAGVPYWDIAPFLPSGISIFNCLRYILCNAATFVKGKINDPAVGSEYWSIEIGIPIRQYLQYEKFRFFVFFWLVLINAVPILPEMASIGESIFRESSTRYSLIQLYRIPGI